MNIDEIRARVNIDTTKLEQELAEQSGMFSYVAEKYIESECEYRMLKGRKYIHYRSELEIVGDKVTEKMIENNMLIDEELQVKRAKKYALKNLKDSLNSRGTMLIQLVILKRQDLANSVALLTQ